jgi:HSP20 family protein
MSLIRWQLLKELDILRHQINHLFDELRHRNHEFAQFPKLDDALWVPAIELTAVIG